MSYTPTPDDVRCAACGEWFHKALKACPMCDAPNAPRRVTQPSAAPRAQPYVAPSALQEPTSKPVLHEGGMPVLVPVQHVQLATELTRQYRTLVSWQIFGFLVVLDGPVLLLFMALTGFLPSFLGVSILFPVAIGLLPLAGLVGLTHAIFRKPALRQKIAEMGVDSDRWAAPLEKPLRTFWTVTAAFTGAMLALGAILYGTMSKKEQEEVQQINQRTSPTVYDWGLQGRQ